MQIKIGEKIKNLRKELGKKQEDLASALGVTNQAVSRWETNSVYPDIEFIPAIANFFGISIDELFGYENERILKINQYYDKIMELNNQNNGTDNCIEESIAYARECLFEFPEEEKLLYALGTVLFTAGYSRYGECHKIDKEGFDCLDTDKHKTYKEWNEAIKIYEKILSKQKISEFYYKSIEKLLILYANIGEKDKAKALISSLPSINQTSDFLSGVCADGKEKLKAFSKLILKMVDECSFYMAQYVIANNSNITPEIAVEIIQNAIKMFDLVITDKNYGTYNEKLLRLNLYLSKWLWIANKHNEAFDALFKALNHAKNIDKLKTQKNSKLTAPLVKYIQEDVYNNTQKSRASTLVEDWPWFLAQGDEAKIKEEMKSDPRWNEWVEEIKKC